MCYIADEFAANTKCRLLFANSSGRPLSPSLLSGHGREVVVGGESLDRFRCPAPSDCQPGTAPQVWSCCTLANPLARRRGPRWSPRRPAQGAAAVRCVLCARLQLLHFLLKRESAATSSATTENMQQPSRAPRCAAGDRLQVGRGGPALSSAKHKTWSTAKHRIWMASIFSDFPVI